MKSAFFMDRITCPSELKVGMVVYDVLANGTSTNSIIWECEITSLPYKSPRIGAIFVDCIRTFRSGGKAKSSMSLRDCGVIERYNNKHKLFSSREAAEAYLDNVQRQNIGGY